MIEFDVSLTWKWAVLPCPVTAHKSPYLPSTARWLDVVVLNVELSEVSRFKARFTKTKMRLCYKYNSIHSIFTETWHFRTMWLFPPLIIDLRYPRKPIVLKDPFWSKLKGFHWLSLADKRIEFHLMKSL